MVQTLVLVAHLIVASLLIVLVLLQRGKGAEAGTGFGGGASGTVFGARGSSSFFSRSTGILATVFFGTSLALAYFATQTQSSDNLLEGSVLEQAVDAPLPSVTGSDGELPGASTLDSELPAVTVPNAEQLAEPVDSGLPDVDASSTDEIQEN